jgi:hypothetical protein
LQIETRQLNQRLVMVTLEFVYGIADMVHQLHVPHGGGVRQDGNLRMGMEIGFKFMRLTAIKRRGHQNETIAQISVMRSHLLGKDMVNVGEQLRYVTILMMLAGLYLRVIPYGLGQHVQSVHETPLKVAKIAGIAINCHN